MNDMTDAEFAQFTAEMSEWIDLHDHWPPVEAAEQSRAA